MRAFGITKNSYISSAVDEKKITLNKYYSELYKKNYSAGKTSIFDFVVVVVIFALVWGCYFLFLVFTKCFFFILLFSGSANGGPAIDSSISAAIQNSKKIYLTKNIAFPEQNIKTTIVVTKTENIAKRNNSAM